MKWLSTPGGTLFAVIVLMAIGTLVVESVHLITWEKNHPYEAHDTDRMERGIGIEGD